MATPTMMPPLEAFLTYLNTSITQAYEGTTPSPETTASLLKSRWRRISHDNSKGTERVRALLAELSKPEAASQEATTSCQPTTTLSGADLRKAMIILEAFTDIETVKPGEAKSYTTGKGELIPCNQQYEHILSCKRYRDIPGSLFIALKESESTNPSVIYIQFNSSGPYSNNLAAVGLTQNNHPGLFQRALDLYRRETSTTPKATSSERPKYSTVID